MTQLPLPPPSAPAAPPAANGDPQPPAEGAPAGPSKRWLVTVVREFCIYDPTGAGASKKALGFMAQMSLDLQGENAQTVERRPVRVERVEELPASDKVPAIIDNPPARPH